MTVRGSNPCTVAEPIGPFRHVTIVPGNTEIAFVSGQIGHDADGHLVPGGCGEQTLQAFKNLELILEDLGATPNDVVKLFTIVAGDGSFSEFSRKRTEIFSRWYPDGEYPAHSAFAAYQLATPEILVEIEAVVAVPK